MLCTPWLKPTDVCVDGAQPAQIAQAIESAQSWLFDSTCQQFTGECTSEIRMQLPCGCDDMCGHRRRYRRLDLSPWVTGSVLSIEEITVNGAVIPDDDYRLGMGRYLIPHDGGALDPWPVQNLNRPDGDTGTWSALIRHGNPPPPHLADAAADLAKELVLYCINGTCRIPETATSMSKDGMTLEFKLPEKGETGLPKVDSIVSLYQCRRRRRMYDPTMPQAEIRRVTEV